MSAFPNILDAYKVEDIPSIFHLAQAYDEDVAVKWVQLHLLHVNEFAGVKTKLSDMQLEELAIQIRLEFGYLNLFEFILFCARLRSGKYEDFYSSVDPMRILKSLDAFCSDRREELSRERMRLEKERSDKEWEESRRNSISFEDWYRGLPEEKKAEVRDSECSSFADLAKKCDEVLSNENRNQAKLG